MIRYPLAYMCGGQRPTQIARGLIFRQGGFDGIFYGPRFRL
jgi:hypothetical protein